MRSPGSLVLILSRLLVYVLFPYLMNNAIRFVDVAAANSIVKLATMNHALMPYRE